MIAIGSATGCLLLWRQNIRHDSFIEVCNQRVVTPQEITSVVIDRSPNINGYRIAIGTYANCLLVFDFITTNQVLEPVFCIKLSELSPWAVVLQDKIIEVYSCDGKRVKIELAPTKGKIIEATSVTRPM
jgi:hypothetical protein